MTGLKGKSIIVTGGASGIGQASALLLAEAGCLVTIVDVNEAQCANTLSLIVQAGGRGQYALADVTDEMQVAATVKKALNSYGRLDGACNSAGIGPSRKITHEVTLENWKRCVDVNLTGIFLSLKYQIPAMLESGGGSIVTISSVAAAKGFLRSAEYGASKAGVLGLVRCAAYDYASKGIRVNAVLPGPTLTPMLTKGIGEMGKVTSDEGHEAHLTARTPIARIAQPAEIGKAVLWLLSDDSSYVTGSAIAVDGGMTAI